MRQKESKSGGWGAVLGNAVSWTGCGWDSSELTAAMVTCIGLNKTRSIRSVNIPEGRTNQNPWLLKERWEGGASRVGKRSVELSEGSGNGGGVGVDVGGGIWG